MVSLLAAANLPPPTDRWTVLWLALKLLTITSGLPSPLSLADDGVDGAGAGLVVA